MRVGCLFVFALTAACSTTKHSTIGPYVRTIVAVPGGVGVESCALDYAHTTQYWSFSSLWSSSGSDASSELTEQDCARSSAATEVAP